MAEKKKSQKAKKKGVLLPDVPETAAPSVNEEETSEQKRRADRTVDQLIESLFGEKKKSGGNVVTQPEPKEIPREPIHTEQRDMVAEMPEEELTGDALLFDEPAVQELSLKEEMEASPADFRLLLELEYEQELGEAIGFERIRTYHEKSMNGRKSSRRRAVREDEFETQEQDTKVRRRYARERTGWLVRLGISVCLLVLMLFYENAALMTRLFDGPLDGAHYPVPYILIGLQILLLDVAVCYRPLREGLSRLLRFSPVDHSVPAAILLSTVLYHVIVLFLPIRQYPVLFLSPAALCITLLAASELLNLYREGFAFDVISARRQKYAILPRVCVGGTQSSARDRLNTNGDGGSVWYLRPVGFVRNYFTNTAVRGTHHRNLGAHFLLISALGTVLALFSFASGAISSQTLAVFFVSLLLCAPAISSLLTALPLFFCACFCLRGRGAIIGEAPLEYCGGRDTLILPDTDLFVAMSHEHFQLLDLCDAHRVTVLIRALLEKVQSPLAAAFGVDAGSRVGSAELTLTHIGAGGVQAVLGETAETVAIGTAKYMIEHELVLPASEQGRTEDIYRLLVAVNGRICAAFCVRYAPVADLAALFTALMRDGVYMTVRSKDPCVREEIFAELFPQLPRAVAVQKPSVDELELRTDRVDSCVVSLGSCKELARTYMFCRRVRRARLWGKLSQLLAVLLGGGFAALLTLAGHVLSGGWITLWMLIWCGVYAFVSYFYLRRPTDDI